MHPGCVGAELLAQTRDLRRADDDERGLAARDPVAQERRFVATNSSSPS
jgi:hypothetical protein